jgi:2-methylcitrate dehydratase PrpD
MTDLAAAKLVAHVSNSTFDDLSDAAKKALKIFILDSLGVTVSGRNAEWTAEVLRAAQSWGAGAEARALGQGVQLSAPAAAFVNAYQAHSQEYDCVHEGAVVHPMATAHSAALAVAERCGGVSGKDFMTAIALGVDASTSIGMAATSGLKFFRPAVAGVFGATVAAGRLEGLTADQMHNALGLAFTQCGGTMQAHREGKPTLALNVAFAARAAVQAVDLAKSGFPGPSAFLTGDFGYFNMMEDSFEIAPAFDDLGKVWRITEVSHKPFSAGRATHVGIDVVLRLREKLGFTADQVEKITLLAPELICLLVGRPASAEMTANYARLCFQFTGALAAAKGEIPLDGYQAENITSPELQALAARIEVIQDDNPDPNALNPQTVILTLKDGRREEVAVADTFGAPNNPLSDDQNTAKFKNCCSFGAMPISQDKQLEVIKMLEDLENVTDISDLASLLAGVSTA